MKTFIFRRFLQALLALFLLSLFIFFIGRLSGDPTYLLLSDEAGEEEVAMLRKHLGLDKPLYIQYGIWVSQAVKGDLGRAFVTGKPVIEFIKERFLVSSKLALASIFITILMGIPLGVVAAIKKGCWEDNICKIAAVLGQSMPAFWVGIMLVWIFAAQLDILPAGGVGGLKHYILPSFTMAFLVVAGIMRLLRSSMLEILDSEFIKMARIKGVSERAIIWKHSLRNSLIPVLSYGGMYLAHFITAAVSVEVVFAWPGMGRLIYEAIKFRDFPVVQGLILVAATTTIVVNLIVDILYAVVDPRIRYS